MVTPEIVFRSITGDEKARQPIARIAGRLGIDPTDAPAMAELLACVEALRVAGDVHVWRSIRGKTLVTMSSIVAYRLRLQLNDTSSKWMPVGAELKAERVTPTQLDGGRVIVSEADLTEVPPGTMARIPDRRTEVVADPDHGLQRILADEKRLGLVRPTLPIVGVVPWIAADWERDHDIHGKPFPGGGLGPVPKAGKPVCEVCGGRPMRALTTLAPMRVGRNRANRPPEVIDGGEVCTRCLAHFQEDRWPRVTRLPAEPDATGKTNGKAGKKN